MHACTVSVARRQAARGVGMRCGHLGKDVKAHKPVHDEEGADDRDVIVSITGLLG